ncbi:MAG: hypothetical protein GF408_00165, partial [Candidatus Omnitrophica bacterium]|nr:hypothetical protein [Candidatus Omnitrophota bacterium]
SRSGGSPEVLILRSGNLGFRAAFTAENGDIVVESLRGALARIRFDLKGEIKNIFSKDIRGSFNGTCESDLRELNGTGFFPTDAGLKGTLTASTYLDFSGMTDTVITAWGTMSLSGLEIKGLDINEISGKFSFEEGRFSVPLLNGFLYDGSVSGRFLVDVIEQDLPFAASLNINNINYRKLMEDLGVEEQIYGSLSLELDLKGYAKNPDTAEGTGEIMIAEADLGPMPILTPLLGDIYSGIEIMFSDADPVTINEAYADFIIENRKIRTDNLTFLGDSIAVTSKGYLDFDGKVDFYFENQFLPPSPGRRENWQTGIRDAIISLGRSIGRARLRGTLNEPRWEFDYGPS